MNDTSKPEKVLLDTDLVEKYERLETINNMSQTAISNLQEENKELKKCIEGCLKLCENISSEIKRGEDSKWNLTDLDVEEIDKLLQMQFKVYNKWSTVALDTVVGIREELRDTSEY